VKHRTSEVLLVSSALTSYIFAAYLEPVSATGKMGACSKLHFRGGSIANFLKV
jgi:hypothetical protein